LSNQNKQTFSLPGRNVPPPPAAAPPSDLPALAAAKLEAFPLPWVVGPHSDIWVAADVEQFDPETETSVEKVRGPNGTFWRSTCAKPRLVMEDPADNGIAELIVHAVNKLKGA